MDKNEFIELCELSCIYIDPKETSKYLENINEVEDYINMLDRLDLEGIDITIWPEDSTMVLREDEAKESTDKEEIMQNSPMEAYGYFALNNMME